MKDPQVSKWEKVLSRIFLVQILILFLFFLGEFIFRTFFSLPFNHKHYEVNQKNHVPRPYVMAAADPKKEGINELGYIGPLPSPVKGKEEYRIFVLGGSTVYGINPWEKERSPSLPALLEQELRKTHPHVKVFNFGIPSSVTLQDTVRILIDVWELEPDLILAYGGGNEIFHEEKRAGYPHRFKLYEVSPLWQKDVVSYPVIPLTLFGSQMMRKVFPAYFEKTFLSEKFMRSFAPEGKPFFNRWLENYHGSLSRMASLSESLGSKFLAVFQPLKSFHSKVREPSVLKFYQDFKAAHKGPLLDFSHLLQDKPLEWWMDDIHVVPEAEQFIAKSLAKNLLENGYLP